MSDSRFRPAYLGVAAIALLLFSGCAASAPIDEAKLPQVVHAEGEKGHTFPPGFPSSFRTLNYPLDGGDMGNLEKGEALYQANCARCHGPAGRGDGPDAKGLTPKPADLVAGHASMMSDGLLFYLVTTGIKDTAMPSWKDMSQDDRWRIIFYVRDLAPPAPTGGGGHGGMNM